MTAQSLIARDATDPMRVRRLTRLLLRLGCILAACEQLYPATEAISPSSPGSLRMLWIAVNMHG